MVLLIRVNFGNSRKDFGGKSRSPDQSPPFVEHEPDSRQRYHAGKGRAFDAAPNGLPLPVERADTNPKEDRGSKIEDGRQMVVRPDIVLPKYKTITLGVNQNDSRPRL